MDILLSGSVIFLIVKFFSAEIIFCLVFEERTVYLESICDTLTQAGYGLPPLISRRYWMDLVLSLYRSTVIMEEE